ncbi:unnamed protein product [Caenorhabditis nigoni]
MGTYRHLMVYFCCCSIVFSIIDLCVQPNIQTYKSAYFMFVDVKKRNLDPFLARIGLNALCGSFGITISGIAVHFVYRFFALERPTILETFGVHVEDTVYTILPVSYLFIPFGLIFTLPMFEINCQLIASLITLIFATYPALDPLPILYFVDFYRNPIIETFKKSKCKGSQVSPNVENSIIVE